MSVTQYIGARYVPVFADPVDWNDTRTYEPLTIVLHGGNSYTSKQYVPKGIDINNEDFWALTANYNSQVELYREETIKAVNTATASKEIADSANTKVEAEINRAQAAEKVNADMISAISSEMDTFRNMATVSFETVSDMIASDNVKKDDVIICAKYNTLDAFPITFKIVSEKSDTSIALDNGMYADVMFNNYVCPEMFGAVGDAITDDYDAIKKALSQNVSIYSERTFGTSQPLTYNNFNDLHIKVKALNSNFSSPVFTINVNFNSEDFYSACKNYYVYVDANKNDIGLQLDNCFMSKVAAYIVNALTTAVNHNRGYGNHFYICASNKKITASATCLVMNATDNVVDYLESENFKYGVNNANGFNSYSFVHPWIYGNDSVYKDSIGFICGAECSVDRLYNDTMNYGLSYSTDVNVYVGELKTMFNNNGVSDAAANANPPKFVTTSKTFRADATKYCFINNLYSFSFKNNNVNIINESDYPNYMWQRFVIKNMIGLSYNGTIRNSPFGTYGVTNIKNFTDLVTTALSSFDNYVIVNKSLGSMNHVSTNSNMVSVTFTETITQQQAFIAYITELSWDKTHTYTPSQISLKS